MRRSPGDIRRVVILTLTGLGNTLLYLPTLRELARRLPHAQLDAVCASAAAREFFEACPEITNVYQIGRERTMRPGVALAAAVAALRLRPQRYDVSLTVFPSNRLACTALAVLIGARRRLAHRYAPRYHWRNMNALLHTDVRADDTLHDIEQNRRLLAPLLGEIESRARPDDLLMPLRDEDRRAADALLEDWSLQDGNIVGMHVTSYPDMTYKRWAPDRFQGLIERLLSDPARSVIIVGAPDERAYIENIARPFAGRVKICADATLMHATAVVSRCDYFVSNDSGLMHVAALCGVPTLGIFGPTNPSRTAPSGPQHRVVAPDHPCTACYRYPFAPSPGLRNCMQRSCLEDLGVDTVYDAFVELQRANPIEE
jgi:heptosyltransferase-2